MVRAMIALSFMALVFSLNANAAPSKSLELTCELIPQFEESEFLSEYDLAEEATIRFKPNWGVHQMDVRVEGSLVGLTYGLNHFSWKQESIHGYDESNETIVDLKFNRASRKFEGLVVLDEDFAYRALCTGNQSLIGGQRR